MKRGHLLTLLLILNLVGCAHLMQPPKKSPEISPKGLKEELLREYLQGGKHHEEMGNLVAALRNYTLARTVDPSSDEARVGSKRVEKELKSAAEQHYKAGIEYHKQGKYGRARHQFLIALRLRPDHAGAIKMLTTRKRIKIKRYVVHTLRPGDNLAKVARTYYGDYRKFPVIAKYNNIMNATKVFAGQEIKVPEIEGVKFLARKEEIQTAPGELIDSGLRAWEKYASETTAPSDVTAPEEEDREPQSQVASYRDDGVELFETENYPGAIEAFNKVLNADPNDNVALEYAYRCHLQQGKLLFERKHFLAARDQFKECLRYKHDCQTCQAYLEQCETVYKEIHYKRGIEFFDQELVEEAIHEWELVQLMEPTYKRVDYLISKAKTILRNIREIQQCQEEQGSP